MSTTDFDNGQNESRGRVAAVADKVRDGADTARAKASDAYSAAREKTSNAYGSVRERASTAAGTVRAKAGTARRTTANGIDANPAGALLGGLAIGALAAVLLPVTRRETEALGSVGRRVTEGAREAARAAKEAGRGKLDELGLNKDAAKQTLGDIASKAGEAVRTSATAAAQTVTSNPQA